VRRIVAGGAGEVVIDLGAVAYIDSPAIGCLLDIHRLLDARGGTLRLSSVQARVGTMLSMTGVDNILGVRRKKAEAPAPFQRDPEGWRTAGLPPELAV
jgi:anti-sigma B factor antagonist